VKRAREALERRVQALLQRRPDRANGGGDRVCGQDREAGQRGLQAGAGVLRQRQASSAGAEVSLGGLPPSEISVGAAAIRASSAQPSAVIDSSVTSGSDSDAASPAGSSARRVACTATSAARSANPAAIAISIGAARASW
jgi:hypothetical protein